MWQETILILVLVIVIIDDLMHRRAVAYYREKPRCDVAEWSKTYGAI